MAGIDYSIPGQFKGLQLESPMNAMAQAMQLRNLRETSQINALKAQEYQRAQQEDNELARIMSNTSLEFGSEPFMREVLRRAPSKYEGIATRATQRENLLAQKEKREFDLKAAEKKEKTEALDTRLKQFNDMFPAYNISSEADVENRIRAMANDEILGPVANRFGTTDETVARNVAEYRRNPRNYIARLSGVSAEKILEAADARDRESYESYSLAETLAGREPVPENEFFARQRGAPVLAPAPAPAPTTTEAAPAPVAVEPVLEPALSEDKTLPVNTTTVKKTGVDYLDPTAEGLYKLAAKTKDKDKRLALTAMAKEIQDAFRKDLENSRPVYSEIKLQDRVVIAKRDPATGRTTVVDTFDEGISPADKQRFINDSIKIKQENRKIALDARRVDLQAKRDSLEAQKVARDADPAFQQRMAAARATGEATAKDEVKAKQMLPSLISRAEENIRLIDELVGAEPVKDKNGKIIKAGTKPHPGFETAVGATWQPGARFIDGTDASDFARRDQQLKGASFLEAFEMLKGGGSITNIEGEKGTAAINRMSIAQSEQEYITAAREVQGILRTGMERARKRAKAAAPNTGVFDAADAILGK
jgi:hypothetical protein